MVEEILKEMIIYANGNKKDIAHFLKVHSYARLIGKLEQLDEKTQKILEIAAIVHDIACPLCRKKYGNSNGKFQEIEGPDLVYDFLKPFSLTDLEINRIAYLVGHHHTYENIDGLDYQILLEADFLVNGDEMNADNKTIAAMKNKVFKTATGIKLLEYIYE
ncbi:MULTISPECIES: HD domain-containing protein [unclassified Thomasclavelia]|uniref:HD domain-containing protein n=1 Tax=unclassified Thomasclavelia TaxID=3025756 RepID=UPI000B3A159C|nr:MULTISPECIES: HD domain-containing protein [unclassified Thomasclavelia]OUP76673.1 phosphohydrolase [Erysipelatoclostridium sp. An173]OUQ08903.1 phosphohydrolase [Erysipelatoclostridium sp. An15]WRK52514.1 HD domain-containing protein [Coprobacillaceae bacterium CR2/5/TPMF4]